MCINCITLHYKCKKANKKVYNTNIQKNHILHHYFMTVINLKAVSVNRKKSCNSRLCKSKQRFWFEGLWMRLYCIVNLKLPFFRINLFHVSGPLTFLSPACNNLPCSLSILTLNLPNPDIRIIRLVLLHSVTAIINIIIITVIIFIGTQCWTLSLIPTHI